MDLRHPLSDGLAAPGGPPRGARLPPVLLVAGYLLAFLLLDWLSYIRPLQGLNITPWNPQPALAIALLLARPALWWLVLLGVLVADVLVRHGTGDPFVAIALAAVQTASYLAIAAMLRAAAPPSTLQLRSLRDAAGVLAIIVGGALLAATTYVGTLVAAGLFPLAPPYDAVAAALARYWIGDAVGLLVALPLLLVWMDPERSGTLAATVRRPQAWAIGALAVALLWLAFGRGAEQPFKTLYLLLLPVVWAAARFGTGGAVLASAVTQVGLIVSVQTGTQADIAVFELQVFMAAIATTALLLGVVVDERARSDAELRASLRLAAAGQMSAAIAHELSQPLTALSSHAQACTLLATAPGEIDTPRREQLADVTRRLSADARRAGDVVKRLRDLFMSGATQLRHVRPVPFVDEAIAAQERHAQALGVRISREPHGELPEVWADPVQLAIVLRNLIGNAIDAAAAGPAGSPPQVHVRLHGTPQQLRVDVADSGGGPAAERLATLFEPGHSEKPGGMGVGLSIARAIVEAHGGRLWAEPGPTGRFCFTLPVAEDDDAP